MTIFGASWFAWKNEKMLNASLNSGIWTFMVILKPFLDFRALGISVSTVSDSRTSKSRGTGIETSPEHLVVGSDLIHSNKPYPKGPVLETTTLLLKLWPQISLHSMQKKKKKKWTFSPTSGSDIQFEVW